MKYETFCRMRSAHYKKEARRLGQPPADSIELRRKANADWAEFKKAAGLPPPASTTSASAPAINSAVSGSPSQLVQELSASVKEMAASLKEITATVKEKDKGKSKA